MEKEIKEIMILQFGAAIDMLKNAIKACPADVWGTEIKDTEFWYIAYHPLFWLDLYSSESGDDFHPPVPFGLEELDPSGLLPERVYSKDELLNYLEYGRRKCYSFIEQMTEEKFNARFIFGTLDLSYGERVLYNMRHVQHHTAQLNFILSRKTGSAPKWVRKTS